MKSDHSHRILAVYSLSDKACRDHFAGVLDALSDRSNWHLEVTRPGPWFTEKDIASDYDGFIISMPGTEKAMQALARSDKPTVLVNITDRQLASRSTAISFVWTDNTDIGRCGARHLLERGTYRSAGFVHELQYEFYSREREIAFRAQMKKIGCKSLQFPSNNDFTNYHLRLRTWLRDLPKPAAIMAVSDMRVADVINACRDENILVPEQVAIVGVDNDLAQHEKCGMGISSVLPDFREMGRSAARELDFLFKHPKRQARPHEILIPVKQVISRESSARSLPAVKLVEHALAFIRANRNLNIRRKDVVASLGCSLQLAELRFRQITGKTIRATIEDVRMEEAAHRLRTHGATVKKIAEEMHFPSSSHLSRTYRRHYGRPISADRIPAHTIDSKLLQ